MRSPAVLRARLKTLRLAAALLGVLGQMAVVSAGVISREDASAAAHVESSGVSLHHAHNEDTCLACRVLTFHSTVQPQAQPLPPVAFHRSTAPGLTAGETESPTLLDNLSRAPPAIA